MFAHAAAIPHDDKLQYRLGTLRHAALRKGDWKIVYRPDHELYEPVPEGISNDKCQWYNLSRDPAETLTLIKFLNEQRKK